MQPIPWQKGKLMYIKIAASSLQAQEQQQLLLPLTHSLSILCFSRCTSARDTQLNMVAFSKFSIAAVALISSVVAHPGDSHEEKRREAMRNHASAFKAKRALDACKSNVDHQALQSRNIARRAAVATELRQKREISASRLPSSRLAAVNIS